MHNLPLVFKHLFRTKDPWSYLLEAIWVRRQSWAIPVLMISAVIFGVVFGWQATSMSSKTITLIGGGLVVFFVLFSRPDFLILLILILSSSIVDYKSLPMISRLTPIELCLGFLLGFIALRTLLNREKYNFVRTPLDWPVFLFLVASTISFYNAKYFLGTYNYGSFAIWRALFMYMVFFAVTNFVRTRRQLLTLVGGMFVIAAITAALMIAQQAVGTSVSIMPGQQTVSTATSVSQGAISGVARVKGPGQGLVYVMLLPAFILYVTPEYLRGRKWLGLIPVILFPLAIAFTFTRGLWLGVIIQGILFILIYNFKSKRFIGLVLALVVGATAFVSLLDVYFPRIDNVVGALSARFDSIMATDEFEEDSSAQYRLKENEVAIPKIKEYPILGLGLGAEWRDAWDSWDARNRRLDYIHNGYLYILIDMGIVGFLPFLWFSIAHLVTGVSAWYRLQDPILKGLVIGFTLSYLGLLVNTTSSPRVMNPAFIVVLGLIMGVNQVAIRLEQQSIKPKPVAH